MLMTKRLSLFWAGLLFLSVFLWACGREKILEDAHVIVIVIDTLRQDRLGVYGYPKDITPFMDQLAEEGILFKHALAPSSWTKPSVASVLTGLYPRRHGVVGSLNFLDHLASLDEAHITLPERLQAAGYRTGAFMTNPHLLPAFHFDQGFDTFVQPAGKAPVLLYRALQWIEGLKNTDKFFLYLHIIDPHAPYVPPEAYRDRFVKIDPGEGAPFTKIGNPLEISLWLKQYKDWDPDSSSDRFRFDYSKLRPQLLSPEVKKKLLDSDPTLTLQNLVSRTFLDFSGVDDPALLKRKNYLAALYDGEVSSMDQALRRFVEKLSARGLLDQTVLVVSSDHGESFLEHGQWGHYNNVYAEEVNIPLILRIPGPHGPIKGAFDHPASLVDLYPTILDLLGLSPPSPMDGASLWPMIRDAKPGPLVDRPVLTEVFHESGEDHVAAVLGRKKLLRIEKPDRPVQWIAYDLALDPYEKKPMAPGSGGPEMEVMRRAIEDWLEKNPLQRDGTGKEGLLSEEEIRRIQELGYN
jgi:arylsulfatase A-like enzyme